MFLYNSRLVINCQCLCYSSTGWRLKGCCRRVGAAESRWSPAFDRRGFGGFLPKHWIWVRYSLFCCDDRWFVNLLNIVNMLDDSGLNERWLGCFALKDDYLLCMSLMLRHGLDVHFLMVIIGFVLIIFQIRWSSMSYHRFQNAVFFDSKHDELLADGQPICEGSPEEANF